MPATPVIKKGFVRKPSFFYAKYPWESMSINESFEIRYQDAHNTKYPDQVPGYLYQYGNKIGRKYYPRRSFRIDVDYELKKFIVTRTK